MYQGKLSTLKELTHALVTPAEMLSLKSAKTESSI